MCRLERDRDGKNQALGSRESQGEFISAPLQSFYMPQLSRRGAVMSDYLLNINPGNQFVLTIKVSVSPCYQQTLGRGFVVVNMGGN